MPHPSSGFVVWTVLIGSLLYGLFIFIRFFLRIQQRNRFAKNFPCPPTHWLYGNLHQIPGANEECYVWLKKLAADYSEGFVILWLSPFHPTILVYHPESVKVILKTSEPKAVQLGTYFNMLPVLGDGLLVSGGKKWERNRRLLNPAFRIDILRSYMVVNNRCTDILIDKLEKFAERTEYFEVFTHISLLTLDVILRCAFSYDNDCQLKGYSLFQLRGYSRGWTHPFVKAINSLADTAVHRTLKPWLYPDFIFYLAPVGRQFSRDRDFVLGVSDEIIRNRKAALACFGEKSFEENHRLDFLDILLTATDSDGHGLTDQEIRDETIDFLIAGHDTTVSGISWTLYSLAKYPEHLKRCQEEVDEVLKEKPDKDIDYDDLPKLKYLTMCIKESQRIHTTVPVIQRETTKDMTIGGRHVPAGTFVNVVLHMLHNNEKVWTDPDEYRPDRFSPENLHKIDAFAYCPFSAGPRNCIGLHFGMQEMKTVIARIINRFDISLDLGREVRHQIAITLKAENGIYMKATPRNNVT